MKARTPDEYIDLLPPERKEAVQKLRKVLQENLPEGFEETINYGMIGFVVPHSIYPNGYHADPKLPLPFIHIASQKSHIAIYHSGLYVNQELLDWFKKEFPKYSDRKLDMGKSCLRFKKPEHIPYELMGKLAQKMTPQEWIKIYETQLKR
jgi:uncharacterized protein YdhG (YjbR/CyaY superfamily)